MNLPDTGGPVDRPLRKPPPPPGKGKLLGEPDKLVSITHVMYMITLGIMTLLSVVLVSFTVGIISCISGFEMHDYCARPLSILVQGIIVTVVMAGALFVLYFLGLWAAPRADKEC